MKVLVANRGEIACRILRSLRESGIASAALFTPPDADALHVSLADEAHALPEPGSYLEPTAVLAAARKAKATALHPGYGFLSQNASFARACAAEKLVYIGPAPEAHEALGNKRSSREVARRAGVPIVPGVPHVADVRAAREAAGALGYPVLLKAASGGGGRGMRRVESDREMADHFAAAAREAELAFGDPTLLLEKLIHPARHVEAQIVGDSRRVVAYGERECSLQRRYQKLIEETPSPGITEATRRALLDSAVRLAAAVGYRNAGTVEFLVGPDGAHYFLEVNTRLQVEHPVTEAVTGLDLVRIQVAVAHGEFAPDAPQARGHAIEARLNAEDVASGFLPQAGTLLALDLPHGPGIRVDSGVREGVAVSTHYDSLLAKIVAHGDSREAARRRLVAALRESTALGVATNRAFLIRVLESEAFRSGETYTHTIEASPWPPETVPPAVHAYASSLMATAAAAPDGVRDRGAGPWDSMGAFRIGGPR